MRRRPTARPFHGILVAVVLIMLSAFIPRSSERTKTALRPSDLSVRRLQGSEAQRYITQRVEAQLDRARKQGFRVLESTVFAGSLKGSESALSDRLVGAHADTFTDTDGVVVFTVLDDGNYSNVEFAVYYYDHGGTYEVWGNQQIDLNSQQTAEWDYGIASTYPTARNENLLERLCDLASPAVNAQRPLRRWQGRACEDAGAMFRGVLTRASSYAAGGFATAALPCVGASIGWGACVAGAATGGFVWGIIYEGYDAGMGCGGVDRPFHRAPPPPDDEWP